MRPEREFAEKAQILQKLGFNFIQLHDDDAVQMTVPSSGIGEACTCLKRVCDDHGLTVEFIAPRLWEDPRFSDGGITANNAASRELALDRAKTERRYRQSPWHASACTLAWRAKAPTPVAIRRMRYYRLTGLRDYCNAILAL